jgi:two-component sensor histidine kinase
LRTESFASAGPNEAGPPVNPPARKGFGTHIVGRLVREQSKGDMRLDWNPGGLGCEIVLALTSRSNPTGF